MAKYCRICIKTDKENYINVLDNNPLNIKEKLNKLLDVQVFEGCGLPEQICLECLRELNHFNDFFTMCKQNQVILNLIFPAVKIQEPCEQDFVIAPSPPLIEPQLIVEGEVKGNSEKSIGCYICQTAFASNQEFKQHFQSTHPSETLRYSCEVCNKTVLKYRSYTRHIESHNAEKRFSCDICNRSFSQKITLAQHLNTHSNIKTYRCECGQTFKQYSSLFKHRKQKHSNESTATCVDCQKTFVSSETLLQHRKSRHNLGKDIHCPHCQKSFASRSALKYHISSIHQRNVDIASITCKICKKKFKTSIILSRHIKKFHD